MDGIFGGYLRAGLMASAAIVCVAAPAQAQTRNFNVPAQDASTGVAAFGRQADIQLLISARDALGRQTSAVRGSFTVEEGLRRLLENSGLSARRTGAQTFSVVPATGEGQAGGAAADEAGADAGAIPEILVVGQRSLNADIRRTENDAQPYVVIGRTDVETSGAANLQDLLTSRVTMANSVALNQTVGELGAFSSIGLRGLSPAETLILIDGRRAAGNSFVGLAQQPDLNAIPLAAVERIEVLPTTAAGIYGGNATGGVINVILRRDFSGVDLAYTFEMPEGGSGLRHQVDLTGGFGFNGGRSRILLTASYSTAEELPVSERDFVERGRALILANNPATLLGAASPPLGATTNIRSTSGAVLTLKPQFGGASLGASRTFVPYLYAGPASDNGAGLIANAGFYNLDLAATAQGSGGGRRSLLNRPEISSLALTARHQFSPAIEAYLDLGYSSNEGRFTTTQASSSFTFTANSPLNPFNQDIRVTTPALGTDGTQTARLQTYRAAGGLIATLGRGWSAGLDLVWNRTSFDASTPAGLTAAATTAVTNGTLAIFRDTNAYPVDFGPFVAAPTTTSTSSTLFSAAARASGPLVRLPAGPVMLTTLAEYRRDAYDDFLQVGATFGSLYPRRTQVARSVYAEAAIPLVAPANAVPFVRSLDLRLAGRIDDYSISSGSTVSLPQTVAITRSELDFFTVNPTVALRYEPVAGVLLRASYGTGFTPPQLSQIVPLAPAVITDAQAPQQGLRDPRRGNEVLSTGYTLLLGGQPGLEPEESESWSAGIVLTPAFVPRLRLSADWTRIDKVNNIVQLPFQDSINLEPFIPGIVERGPVAPGDPFGVGRIIGIDNRQINVGVRSIEALDFALDYAVPLRRLGRLTLSANLTHNLEDRSRVRPEAPILDQLGLRDFLDWKANASLSWEYRGLVARWTTTYYDSYWLLSARTVVPNQGSARIASQTYHDLFLRYRLPVGDGLLAGLELHAGVRNILNSRPPVVVQSIFTNLYSNLGDPRLRTFIFGMRTSF